jgi:serine phosphatase RsbU (regulator of sigma subunit)
LLRSNYLPPSGGADIDGPDDGLLIELVDGLAEAVIICTPQGVAELANAAARRLLPDLVVGKPLAQCGAGPLTRALAAAANAFDGEHHGRRLRGLRRRLADGRTIWYIRESALGEAGGQTDLTAEHLRTDSLLAERARAAFLSEAGNQLSMSLQREQTLRSVVTLPVPFLADSVAVVLPPLNGQCRWIRYGVGDEAPADDFVSFDRLAPIPGLVEIFRQEPSLVCRHGRPGEAGPSVTSELSDLDWLLPRRFGPTGTVLVVPLPVPGPRGRLVSALLAARTSARPGFDPRDVALVQQFAARAGAALATATVYGEQARMAQVLQASLLPPRLPQIEGAVLAAAYRPARETLRIGGDFYDAFATDGGGMFALGDVCGKGLEAAVLSGRVRQSVHSLRMVTDRPLRLMDLLNKALMTAPDANHRSQFTTLLLGTWTAAEPDGLAVTIAGGGHPAPLICHPDGKSELVTVGGMPVGALVAAEFREIDLNLGPGDTLLAYSDGVTEARGGDTGQEMFGEDRLRAAVAESAGTTPDELVDRLLRLVGEWLGGRDHDDIALLAIGAPPLGRDD